MVKCVQLFTSTILLLLVTLNFSTVSLASPSYIIVHLTILKYNYIDMYETLTYRIESHSYECKHCKIVLPNA